MFNKKKEIKEVPAIDKMAGASFPVLPFSFNGIIVHCKVRCLNRVQLRAIGEFNLIDIRRAEELQNSEVTTQDMIDVINYQEALVKETLISPTFEEIQDRVYGHDNKITTLKIRLNKIRELIRDTSAKDRKELNKEADTIELYIGSLLPTDFMDTVTSWATGTNRSDIKKITRDMLLEAAILASNGKDNPAEHLKGDFLDFHSEEINKSAWAVFNEYQNDKEKEKSHSGIFKNMRTVTGGKVKI